MQLATVHELKNEEVQSHRGLLVLEFGTSWCGYCRAAQPHIQAALKDYPQVMHIKVEDGKGKRLGRQFRVKLWPTLVLLKDGIEVDRLVRPEHTEMIKAALLALSQQPGDAEIKSEP
jgi:thioredoxin 1